MCTEYWLGNLTGRNDAEHLGTDGKNGSILTCRDEDETSVRTTSSARVKKCDLAAECHNREFHQLNNCLRNSNHIHSLIKQLNTYFPFPLFLPLSFSRQSAGFPVQEISLSYSVSTHTHTKYAEWNSNRRSQYSGSSTPRNRGNLTPADQRGTQITRSITLYAQ